MPSQLITLPEAARQIGITDQTLYAWRSQGRGPASLRVGGRVKFRQEAIDEWIAEQEQVEAERVAKINARIAG